MSGPLLGIGMDSNRSQFMARQRIESEINHATVTQVRDSLGAAIVAFYAVCFLTVLSIYGYRPHMAAYVTGLLFPLLGMLLLNSQRHREMCRQLVMLRKKRQAALADRKPRRMK
ncbi:hypothetical protein [Pseudomonas fluorescens]|uniref:hypothetical protein n=1 Tax=Pseudomonas TaxID=286 RepID=UPI003D08A28E